MFGFFNVENERKILLLDNTNFFLKEWEGNGTQIIQNFLTKLGLESTDKANLIKHPTVAFLNQLLNAACYMEMNSLAPIVRTRKIAVSQELNDGIENINSIQDLCALFDVLNSTLFNTLRQEEGGYGYFQTEGITRTWSNIIIAFQKQALDLFKSSTMHTEDDKKMFDSIFKEKLRLGYSSPYSQEYELLKSNPNNNVNNNLNI